MVVRRNKDGRQFADGLTKGERANEALVERGNTTEAYRTTLAIEYRRVLQDGHAASID